MSDNLNDSSAGAVPVEAHVIPPVVGERDATTVPSDTDASATLHVDPARDSPPVTPPVAQPVPVAAPVDYSSYKIGDQVGAGLKIKKIFFQTDEFIIFAPEDGGVYFGGTNVPEELKGSIADFYKLSMDAEALKGAHRSDINRLFGYSLARAAVLPQGADRSDTFNHVAKFIDEHSPVARVFIRTDDYTVFVDRMGVLTFEYPELPPQVAPAVTEFRRLSQISTASLNEVDREIAIGLLGTQLAVAFQTASGDSSLFAAPREFIQRRLEAATRVDYVVGSSAAAILLSLIAGAVFAGFALSSYSTLATSHLFLGALGGVVGALISVLQRSATLEVQQFVPRTQVMVQAVVRLGLGSLFGLLLICASLAGVVTIASTSFAIFLLGVVAGFSERLMPDLLTRLATTVDSAQAGTPAPGGSPGTPQHPGPGNSGDPAPNAARDTRVAVNGGATTDVTEGASQKSAG